MDNQKITSGGKERIEDAVNCLAPVFADDPAITYMLARMSKEKRLAYMNSYFRSLLTAAGLNGGEFEEINDWAACTVWIPPRRRVDNPLTWLPSGLFTVLFKCGVGGCWKMIIEFGTKSDAAKKKGLKGAKDYYYLFFVGTSFEHRRKGLASTLIQRYQAIATQRNLPIWLEATTEKSRNVYAKLGFETIDEIVLGRGTTDSDGTKKKGGEGVKIWAMLWMPAKESTKIGD